MSFYGKFPKYFPFNFVVVTSKPTSAAGLCGADGRPEPACGHERVKVVCFEAYVTYPACPHTKSRCYFEPSECRSGL